MSKMNNIYDSLWFGEQIVGSLSLGGVRSSELAQHWRTSGLEDDDRKFTRELLRNIRLRAEELYGCVFICDTCSRRWCVEGGDSEVKRFVEGVRLLRAFVDNSLNIKM